MICYDECYEASISPLGRQQHWLHLRGAPQMSHLSSTDIQSFLGFAGYYKRFVEELSYIAYLLTTIIKNKSKFEWLESCEKSFQL